MCRRRWGGPRAPDRGGDDIGVILRAQGCAGRRDGGGGDVEVVVGGVGGDGKGPPGAGVGSSRERPSPAAPTVQVRTARPGCVLRV
jgi:hypothetical protein